ncbi:putative dehydrogenase [Paramicrobacterium agarici]|uniref:Putative dehydrogenase n=2 Tax=Paramicrobacterium agarici TaxID=630514 RepID=A0A2A9DWG2_9MICO|nr:putative dehydrogenase [Microbacterium agarici]TQO23287.1 putative dehydrogenase [Microbacterium agarici]
MAHHTIGLIGAGFMAATHAAAWAQLGAEIVVWSPRSAQSFASQHGVAAADSFEDLLHRATIVDIASPTPHHAEQIRAAISADLPIVCEKPVARTTDVARDLVLSAEAAGIPLLPAHVVRYMDAYARAHAAVASGALGRVSRATFTREAATPAGGTWFDDDAASGGILMDFLIHDFDQARWMFGEVQRVEATQHPATEGGIVPALVEARVELTHVGGAVTNVVGRWGPPETEFRTTFRIDGDAGEFDHDLSVEPHKGDAYRAQLSDFADAITDGAPARVTAADGLAAVRIAEAAHRSAASGTPVGLI